MSDHRCTPAVSRTVRTTLAGVAWSGAGVMLLSWASTWLSAAEGLPAVALGTCGLLLGVAAWRFLFSKLAARNRARISAGRDRACVFGFQSARSYWVMGAMIAMGVALRHSAIPKTDLAVVYVAIGSALLLSSLGYYSNLIPARTGGPQ